MATDKEIADARKKLLKKHKKHILMNEEKKKERAYYKKHGYAVLEEKVQEKKQVRIKPKSIKNKGNGICNT